MSERRPLVVHLLFRFDTGGLENGVVNLINHMDASRWRHAVVAMTEVTEFRRRIQREDVQFLGLNKPPGPGVLQWGALYRMCRELRPDIVHSRNLAALEGQLVHVAGEDLDVAQATLGGLRQDVLALAA